MAKERVSDNIAKEAAESMTVYFKAMSPSEKAAFDHEIKRALLRGHCHPSRNYRQWCEAVDRALPPGDPELSGMSAADQVAARLTRIEQQGATDATSMRALQEELVALQDSINNLRTKVEAMTSQTQASVATLTSLAQMMRDNADDEAEINALADEVEKNATALADAAKANTPSTEPPAQPEQPIVE